MLFSQLLSLLLFYFMALVNIFSLHFTSYSLCFHFFQETEAFVPPKYLPGDLQTLTETIKSVIFHKSIKSFFHVNKVILRAIILIPIKQRFGLLEPIKHWFIIALHCKCFPQLNLHGLSCQRVCVSSYFLLNPIFIEGSYSGKIYFWKALHWRVCEGDSQSILLFWKWRH